MMFVFVVGVEVPFDVIEIPSRWKINKFISVPGPYSAEGYNFEKSTNACKVKLE
jgi:hypothetical protein